MSKSSSSSDKLRFRYRFRPTFKLLPVGSVSIKKTYPEHEDDGNDDVNVVNVNVVNVIVVIVMVVRTVPYRISRTSVSRIHHTLLIPYSPPLPSRPGP